MNGENYPDITLLPDIARFFGITVDQLLQAELPDEKKHFEEYKQEAWKHFCDGNDPEMLEVWKRAYREMPCNANVKEFLMSSYYDTDKVKYRDEILELGTELYRSDAGSYYKGQAIKQIANTCAASGNLEQARKWALRSIQLNHSQEVILASIESGEELLHQVSFFTCWILKELFYMAARICNDEALNTDPAFVKNVASTVVQIFETAYPDDDADYESLRMMCILHEIIAEEETKLTADESTVTEQLERAAACARAAVNLEAHTLSSPLFSEWRVEPLPSNPTQCFQILKHYLARPAFDRFRDRSWFADIINELNASA